MSAATQPLPMAAAPEPNFQHRMHVLIRSEISAAQRGIRELEAALADRRAHLTIVLDTAIVLGIELLPAVTDATTPFGLAGANGVGQSRGGN